MSRGYFDGLKYLLATVGPRSELARATELVALAHLANTSDSQDLLLKAQSQYPDTIVAFRKLLDDPAGRNTDEALVTAALLGLYEMIVTEEMFPKAHSAHVRGVSAMLRTRDPQLDPLPGARLFRCFCSLLSSPDTLTWGLLSPGPCSESESSPKHLDALMLRSRTVLLQATKVLKGSKASKGELRALRQQAILLDKEFSLWPLCQPKEWTPQTLGNVQKRLEGIDSTLDSLAFWPGNVDLYYDLYVAAVWSTYRKARLKLLQVVADCLERSQDVSQTRERLPALQKLHREARELVDGLCASVPFHLIADLDQLQAGKMIDDFNKPGKALGGLLLMYPLYIASNLSLVPSDQRTWMKGRLRWIGKYMGIRQATMLANNDQIQHLAIADGHALVFSGSLISSSPPAAATSSFSIPR